MTSPNIKYKKSKLGFLIRLVSVLILIGLPLFIFSPELFDIQSSDPAKPGNKLNLEYENFPLHLISMEIKSIILIILEFHTLILISGLFAVAKMLDMFTSERWFLPDFSKQLKIFGISLIVYTLTSGVAKIATITALLIGAVNSSKAIPPNIKFSLFFSSQSLLLLLIGILLIYVSRVLLKASKNAQDLEQII